MKLFISKLTLLMFVFVSNLRLGFASKSTKDSWVTTNVKLIYLFRESNVRFRVDFGLPEITQTSEKFIFLESVGMQNYFTMEWYSKEEYIETKIRNDTDRYRRYCMTMIDVYSIHPDDLWWKPPKYYKTNPDLVLLHCDNCIEDMWIQKRYIDYWVNLNIASGYIVITAIGVEGWSYKIICFTCDTLLRPVPMTLTFSEIQSQITTLSKNLKQNLLFTYNEWFEERISNFMLKRCNVYKFLRLVHIKTFAADCLYHFISVKLNGTHQPDPTELKGKYNGPYLWWKFWKWTYYDDVGSWQIPHNMLYIEEYHFLTVLRKINSAENMFDRLYIPFSYSCWGVLLVILPIFSFLIIFKMYFFDNFDQDNTSWSIGLHMFCQTILALIGTFLFQGIQWVNKFVKFKYKNHKSGMLMVCWIAWGFMVLVLSHTYGTILTSIITKQSNPVLPTTLDEMINGENFPTPILMNTIQMTPYLSNFSSFKVDVGSDIRKIINALCPAYFQTRHYYGMELALSQINQNYYNVVHDSG